jgi:predicted regulator of Ras-like GTPase activity (Roadblock/LC7/MglB family)
MAPVKPVLPISPTPSLKLPSLPAPRPKGQDFLTAAPVARVVRPAQPTPPAPDLPPLLASLSALAQGWPEALRQEIAQLNLTDARVALPAGLVETALKRGRVVFAWKVLRSWIRPVPPANVSVHDGVELELPLSVLAPAVVARQKADAKPQQRVAIDDTIPNLFFGLPKPEPVTAPAPAASPINKVVDTNYYVWDDVSDTARVDESEVKRKIPTGTDFVARYATPNEIVSRAAALDGVAGVLIALPDGLMVANRIPPELNGDTMAAFLPQIFAKVSQTTKELRMGELNNLNFTVGNVPWKIFRVNAIFFAAFGRVGEALPTAPLAALAAELDRKNK